MLCDTKDYEDAIMALDESLKLNPSWADPHFEKAKIYFLIGDLEQGVFSLEHGFKLSPEERFEYDFNKDWKKILEFLTAR